MSNDTAPLQSYASGDLGQIINELKHIQRKCKSIQKANNRLKKYKLHADMHDHLNKVTAFNEKACGLITDYNKQTIVELDAHKLWVDHRVDAMRLRAIPHLQWN